MNLTHIATIYTDLPEKFGLPRQSMLADRLRGEIVFEEAFRDPRALQGIEGFDYLWLVWGFENRKPGEEPARPGCNDAEEFRPLVRPPRLGGNEYMGVFATRSPFRPNPLGLSCVKLEAVRQDDPRGPVLVVSGIDMRSGTKIYDIKPYLPYVESHPDARSGFAGEHASHRLRVVVSVGEGENTPESPEAVVDVSQSPRVEVGDGFKTPPSGVLEPSSTPTGTTTTGTVLTGTTPTGATLFPASWSPAQIDALLQLLAQDPRPAYHDDPTRIYGLSYAGRNVTFRVEGDTLYLLKIE